MNNKKISVDSVDQVRLDVSRHIHYQIIDGNKTNPTLVFLHEGLGCTAMWKDFPGRLCRKTGCPGLVYDRTGYGKSSPSTRPRTVHYLHDYALNELPAIIETLILATPFMLIGHSDGGSISLIFGAERPPFLKGIITEAAHVFVEKETLEGIKKADDDYKQGRLAGLSKYHGDKTHAVFKSWSDTWLSDWFRAWNIEYVLPSIKSPLLVIQGYDDHYGTGRQVTSIVSKTGGDVKSALIENCGHSPHQEKPDDVLTIMAEFIETHK